MASRSERPILAFAALVAALVGSCSFVVPQRLKVRAPSVACSAAQKKEKDYKLNEEISANEVRVIGIVSDKIETGPARMEEANEIMSLRDALEIARNKGVDVILINEEPDPPLVKIFSIGKYVYAEKRKAKELAKNKVPKIKEVKITYTIGDHDLNTKLRNIERWLENKKQQVKVQCVMKGRTRMFEGQARELMERVRREVAHFAKVAGADKGNPTVTKDGRGDLIMMLNAGPDTAILKQLVEEAGGKKALKRQAEEDEDEDEEEEEEEEEETSDEIKAIEAEIKDMREELIDCGISPGQVNTEPEMQDLFKRLDQAKSKLAAAAMASLSPRRQHVAFTASADALLNSPTFRLR
mmetsp:Transcript_39934/g.93471  ORF Transcript_39934/g.93471 Transcript_39934/m.93471 type:complete len:354 (-) Transcript_39934:239-1300(-)